MVLSRDSMLRIAASNQLQKMKTTIHSFALFILLLFAQSAFGKGTQSISLIMDMLPVGDSVFIGTDHVVIGTHKEDTLQLDVPTNKDLWIRRGKSSVCIPDDVVAAIDEILVHSAHSHENPSSFSIRLRGKANQPWIKTTRGKVWLGIVMESKTNELKVDSVAIILAGGFFENCTQVKYGRQVISILGWQYDPSTELYGSFRRKTSRSKIRVQLNSDDSEMRLPLGNQYPYFIIEASNERKGLAVFLSCQNRIPIFD